MRVFILSRASDFHAAAVAWALERAGVEVLLWEGLGWDGLRQASVDLEPKVGVCLGGEPVQPTDVVWYRRPRPFGFHPQMADCDRKFAAKEAYRFFSGLGVGFEASGCRCVNPPTSAWGIDRKAAQIVAAHRAGLRVPVTFMGNDPQKIISRLSIPGTRWVYKSFMQHNWQNSKTGVVAGTATTEMEIPTKQEEAALTFAPGIYQQLIEKQYDVRVTVMGREMRAFKLLARELDWRVEQIYGGVPIQETTTPEEIHAGILRFMAASGIVFGCFDFAVDKSGQWWFLEVNESGQFLWIDSQLPEASVFQDFLAFLTGLERTRFLSLSDFHFDPTTFSTLDSELPSFLTKE